jgi:hypothetical protein
MGITYCKFHQSKVIHQLSVEFEFTNSSQKKKNEDSCFEQRTKETVDTGTAITFVFCK